MGERPWVRRQAPSLMVSQRKEVLGVLFFFTGFFDLEDPLSFLPAGELFCVFIFMLESGGTAFSLMTGSMILSRVPFIISISGGQ